MLIAMRNLCTVAFRAFGCSFADALRRHVAGLADPHYDEDADSEELLTVNDMVPRMADNYGMVRLCVAVCI